MRSNRDQRVNSPAAGKNAECASGKRQQQGLCKKLANNPAAPGSQSGSDSKFLLARSGLREEHMRYIRTGDQKQEGYGSQEHH